VSPRARVRSAWALLVVSLIGWPVSALTFASGEPQVVLGLSWFAITLTALNVVVTADVRKEQDRD
jgi:uncharacterized membrane protein YfcA